MDSSIRTYGLKLRSARFVALYQRDDREVSRLKSVPTNAKVIPINPIINDNPCVLQSPWLRNDVNTSCAAPCGAIYVNTIRMARNPRICRVKMSPSTFGSRLLITVLKNTLTRIVAQNNSVPCHCCGTYC